MTKRRTGDARAGVEERLREVRAHSEGVGGLLLGQVVARVWPP